jgi:hypothetical protein
VTGAALTAFEGHDPLYRNGSPEIANAAQGSQCTSEAWVGPLKLSDIRIDCRRSHPIELNPAASARQSEGACTCPRFAVGPRVGLWSGPLCAEPRALLDATCPDLGWQAQHVNSAIGQPQPPRIRHQGGAHRMLAALAGQRRQRLPHYQLCNTRVDHAAGNYRILTSIASALLLSATWQELPKLDEKLFLQVFVQPEATARRRSASGR